MPIAQLPNVADHPDALMHLVVYLVLAGLVLQIIVSIFNLVRGNKRDYVYKDHLDTFAREIGHQIREAIQDHKTEALPHNGKYVTFQQMDAKLKDCKESRRREVDAELHRRKTHDDPSHC